MSLEELTNLAPGTKLMTAGAFSNGEDPDIEHLLNSVVTLHHVGEKQWVYTEEAPDNPFYWEEIVGLYNAKCIDDENIPYETGDIMSLIGGV